MDFEKLLNPVAEYFDFVVDFATLENLSKFSRLGSVSPKLVSFLFLGILFGIVIKKARAIPTFSEDVNLSNFMNPQAKEQRGNSQQPESTKILESPDLLLLLLFQINGTLFVHLSIVLASKFQDIDFGNFKDSLNATIAVSSIQYPLLAVTNRFLSFIQKIANYSKLTRIISVVTIILFLILTIIPAYYYYKMISIVHAIPMNKLIVPSIFSFLFIIIAFAIAIYFIRIWQKMNLPHL